MDRDLQIFAGEVQRLLDDDDLRQAISKRNPETAARYSWETIAEQTEQTIREQCADERQSYGSSLRYLAQ